MSENGRVVMQITPNLEIGGAQENLRTMAEYLPEVGFAPIVCTFDDGPLRADLERLGVTVELLPARRHSVLAGPLFLAEMLRRRRDLERLVEQNGVDVVQTRGLGTLDFLVMTLRFGRAVRVWWTIENVTFMVREENLGRGRWLLRPKRFAHRLLYRLGARLVTGIIVVSGETERSFRENVGYSGDKVTVVLNGVDMRRYPAHVDREQLRRSLGIGAEAHVMTCVGTFKRQKGQAVLIEALREVSERAPELHVLLVGDGELRAVTEQQVERAGLASQVHFLGSRRDVPALLAASDSFVLPSLWEGLSIALLEAMASGLPIIATEVSGTSQVMERDGSTGWLIPPGDPDALGRAILELLGDPIAAAEAGDRARERISAHFSARGQAEQLAKMFREGTPDEPAARWRPRVSVG